MFLHYKHFANVTYENVKMHALMTPFLGKFFPAMLWLAQECKYICP